MTESEWTVESVRVALERQIADLRVMLDERHTADLAAMASAWGSARRTFRQHEASQEKRFESVNEFRAALSDQAGLFVTRAEANAAHDAISLRVDELRHRVDRAEGQASGAKAAVAYAVTIATLAISVVVLVANVLTR